MGAAKDLFLRIDFWIYLTMGVIFFIRSIALPAPGQKDTEGACKSGKEAGGSETGWKLFLCFAGIFEGNGTGRLLETFSEQSGTDA